MTCYGISLSLIMEILIVAIVLICLAVIYRPFNSGPISYRRRKRKARLQMQLLRMRGEADEAIQYRLIQLLNGDRDQAERLVARQRFGKNGQYSENYYWTQAIRAVEEQMVQESDG